MIDPLSGSVPLRGRPDGPATGEYKHGFMAAESGLKRKISRADVAGLALKQLENDTYLRQTPALSY